jgi:SSS family solute:Na+ symporter
MSAFIGSPADAAVIAVYFIGILVVGSFFARYTQSTTDFFFAGRRFSWWLIAFSGIATLVGSYSFIKYSEAAFEYGLAATQSYTNDWMWMPLLALGWIPIIYYNRIRSIPEYFDLRFGATTRAIYTTLLLLYMLGYVGINLYTLGLAVNAMMPSIEIFPAAVVVACFTAIYVTAGGQSSVIMTDLLQACLLLAAGFVVFFGGIYHLGGLDVFWGQLPPESKHSLGEFAGSSSISFIKIFWQDGMANSFAFWFVNQGMVLRFLSAKSENEARKALLFNALFLMPIAAFAVCNAGLVGLAMTKVGLLPADTDAGQVFVLVSEMVTLPGVFGLIMAALVAALMSTADTLVNGMSAIAINDIWRPYLLPGRTDRFYLNLARIHCVAIMGLGLSLVPLFVSFATIYDAHGAFTAAVTPPLVVSLLLAMTWRGFNRVGALAVLIVGTGLVAHSLFYPAVIEPFAHGVVSTLKEGDPPYKMFKYMRACYGLAVCLGVGVLGSLIGRFFLGIKESPGSEHLSIGPRLALMTLFKGSEPNLEKGEKVLTDWGVDDTLEDPEAVLVPADLAKRMAAREGDLLYVCDERAWLGGLKSAHGRLAAIEDEAGGIRIPEAMVTAGRFVEGRRLRVEKVL